MNAILIISFICSIFFSILFAFPKYFLAKIGYKDTYHPEDIRFEDTIFFYFLFGVFMIGSWIVLFMTLNELDLGLLW